MKTVWVVTARDYDEEIISVYATEELARKAYNELLGEADEVDYGEYDVREE